MNNSVKSNYVKAIFSLVFVFLLVCSCSNSVQSSTSSTPSIDTTYPDATITEGEVWQIGSSTTSKTISGVNGKRIFMVKLNPSAFSSITASNTRIVTSSSLSASRSADFTSAALTLSQTEQTEKTHYTAPVINPADLGGIRENSSYNEASRSVIAKANLSTDSGTTFTLDTTTKQIYVDTNLDNNTFEQKTATLRAVGTHCYVWVVDDYYNETTASNNIVNKTFAKSCAAKFDAMYPIITNAFGYESDIILKFDNSSSLSEKGLSGYDTGTMVNIVVYDISGSGVMGYFHSKDYFDADGVILPSDYKVLNTSNKGKFFYIDSCYANSYLGSTYSTLAHEFQHMIHFNQKYILHDADSSTFFNEMLSMLCEDMMSTELKTLCSDKYNSATDSPTNRLVTFNMWYDYYGLFEWGDVRSYSTAYAFGAFLARNYGGASFIKSLSQSSLVDVAAIENATGEAFITTVEKYLESLVFRGSGHSNTLNKYADTSLKYTVDNVEKYSYPMPAIDLWDTAFHCTPDGKTEYAGPLLYSSSSQVPLKPYGFSIHYIGEASQDSITLNFTTSSQKQLVYIMAQDQSDYDNTYFHVWSRN